MESGNFWNWTVPGEAGGFSDKTLLPACRDCTPSGPCASVEFSTRLGKVGADTVNEATRGNSMQVGNRLRMVRIRRMDYSTVFNYLIAHKYLASQFS